MKIIEVPELRQCSHYPIGCHLGDLKRITKQYVRMVNQFAPKDRRLNFLCRGSSGAILAASVITQIENENSIISHIKKHGEVSHNSNGLNIKGSDYIIIIDDFTSSGETLRIIYEKYKRYGTLVNMLLLTSFLNVELKLYDNLELAICGGAIDEIKKNREHLIVERDEKQ